MNRHKIIKSSLSARYQSKRNDGLREITDTILFTEEIHYLSKGPALYILVGAIKTKAFIDNTSYNRSIWVFNTDFSDTAKRLKIAYNEAAKEVRSKFSFLERFFLPIEKWVIKTKK